MAKIGSLTGALSAAETSKNLYFSPPDARPVPVKVGPVQANVHASKSCSSYLQAATLFGRTVGGPDDVHGAQGVAGPGLVLGTGDQALEKVLLGGCVAVDVYLVVRRQDHGFSLATAGQADPLQ